MVNASDIFNAKILIVDDQEDNAISLKELLRSAGYTDITYTTSPLKVFQLHDDMRYNLIVLDLQMPGMNGFQVMNDLSKLETDAYLPVLAISAEPAYKVHALKAGARDFIAKPFDVDELLMRIHNLVQVRLLHEEACDAATTLEILAQHDPLTGLGNRRLLTARVSAAMSNARRNNSAMALVYMDLDGFKQINDSLGHAVGDALLKMVAERLVAVVRKEDTVARVGGDEFTVALWQPTGMGDVSTVASKLIKTVSQPYIIDDKTVTVTTSAGVAIFPFHGGEVDALMKSADAALYEAKRAGKNVFRVAEPIKNLSAVRS